ncbi:hypothetical protein [Nostoc sp. ChiQUE01b]|uniref:hypothetical protein n=1 Tax=Nostoc sp. ChiQUE01b TaxID=3075376 RepID=UPI002AD2CC7B|nr:hypothetical protein [Nostoc sp. ChiQUE01b]
MSEGKIKLNKGNEPSDLLLLRRRAQISINAGTELHILEKSHTQFSAKCYAPSCDRTRQNHATIFA